jgi:hypothetical protein
LNFRFQAGWLFFLFDKSVKLLRNLIYSFPISDILFRPYIPFYSFLLYFSDFFNDLWTCEDLTICTTIIFCILISK